MKRLRFGVLFLVILISSFSARIVQATRGAPGSADFGYGAWLHLDGTYFEEGLALLGDLRPDWIAIDLDWAQWMPEPGFSPDYTSLDQAFQAAEESQCAVMLSLTNPPPWALTSQGPSVEATARLLASIAGRYPEILQAVELLPAANTPGGWQPAPDPTAYARFYSGVKDSLQVQGISLILAAGGLTPLDSQNPEGISDLDFLRGLYAAGAARWMDVLSLRLPRLSGNPLASPASKGELALRHYEEVRQVMLDHNHQSGLIWITQLSAPDGTIEIGDRIYRDPQRQAEWLQRAIMQIRSQLYIGLVVGHQINAPELNTQYFGADALILKPGDLHPSYSALKAIIQQAHPLDVQQDSGRPKGSSILKSKYKT